MNTPLSNARWLGMALCGGAMEQPWLRPVPATAVGAVVYYALVPGVLGFWLWFAGSSRVSGAEASLMTALVPVSALALAATVLGERITPAQIDGCALVLGAVALTARR